MIKCEECPSFAICVHKIKVTKHPYVRKDYIQFDTTELHNCFHFITRFEKRDKESNNDREILKHAILEAQGLI